MGVAYEYQKIADDLLRRIRAGEWDHGQQIPPIRVLEKDYPQSQMTLYRALRHLAEPLGPRARELFELGLCGLRLELPGFDTGAWSRYDNRGTLAGAHYHRVHVAQLAELAQHTGDPLLSAMHARFAAYPGA